MVQIGTVLNVIDNSGAKKAYCIRINNTSEKKYGSIGNSILVVVKSLRKKRKVLSKVKKGEIYSALVVRTKTKNFLKLLIVFSLENSVILLNKQQKFIGTRIFGSLPKLFRSTKYMKVLSLCSGFAS